MYEYNDYEADPSKKEIIGRIIAIVIFWAVLPFLMMKFGFKESTIHSLWVSLGVIAIAFVMAILPFILSYIVCRLTDGKRDSFTSRDKPTN